MLRVMTHCPRTGAAVPTNLVMDQATFRVVRTEGHNFLCAACGERHTWRSEDAWVEGETALAPPTR